MEKKVIFEFYDLFEIYLKKSEDDVKDYKPKDEIFDEMS